VKIYLLIYIYIYTHIFFFFIYRGLKRGLSVFKYQEKASHHKIRDFIGMPLSVERKPQVESSIVVGVLDTGMMFSFYTWLYV
jgi:hypothetical protein